MSDKVLVQYNGQTWSIAAYDYEIIESEIGISNCPPCPMCNGPIAIGLGYLHANCTPPKTPEARMRERWERVRDAIAPQILERDDHKCLRCGATTDLTIDHIVPIACGGTNDSDNLQTLCQSCNSSKRISTMDYRNEARHE